MAGVNVVVLVGNLTRDPEVKQLPSGNAVCKMRIAVNERVKDRDGNWGDRPNYFDMTAWGATAEACGRYLAKGSRVTVNGSLRWHEWEANDGTKRQNVEINIRDIVFPPGDRTSDDRGRSSEPTRSGGGSYGVPASTPHQPIQDDDDIPFIYCDLFDPLLV